MTIHHVGYLVKNIQESISAFKVLGYEQKTKIVYDDFRKINICFMINGGYTIEFVEPTKDCEFLRNLSKKIGVGAYHICYESERFDDDVQYFLKQGYICIQDKAEAVAINGKNVVFLYNPNVGLIEILEK